MLERICLVADVAAAGRRLDVFVAAELATRLAAPVSRRRARRLIADGAVYLDRHRTRIASRAVAPGARVEVFLEREGHGGPAPAAPRPPLPAVAILHLDRHLVAVDKPAGLSVQPTVADAVTHLFAATAATLVAAGEDASGLRLHHRLDRGTSGVVLFARDPAASAGLSRLFATRRVEKVYRALVAPRPGVEPREAWTVESRLDRVRDRPGGKAKTVAVRSGGREASTDFRLLARRASEPTTALVEARPRTGRTHQIRVHLAEGGLPVVGDRLYGDAAGARSRLWLHAWRLELEHPVTGRPIAIESPPPPELVRHESLPNPG